MTLHGAVRQTEVGVRDLHDHLSRHLRSVQEEGTEVVVTMRGKRIARLVPIDHVDADPLAELRKRGIVGPPKPPIDVSKLPPPVPIAPGPSTADIVSDMRD